MFSSIFLLLVCGQFIRGPSESPYLSLHWERNFFQRYCCKEPACKPKGVGSTIVNTSFFSKGVATYTSLVRALPMNSLEHLYSITNYYSAPSYAILFPEDEEVHDSLVKNEEITRSCHLVDISAVLEYFPSTIHSLRILTFPTPLKNIHPVL